LHHCYITGRCELPTSKIFCLPVSWCWCRIS